MILSILIILVLGMLADTAFTKIKLPGLLGMIIVGIVVGPYGLNLLDESILKNSSDIRMIALVVILMRAGLGLEKDLLKSVGLVSAKMSAIPCLMEGFTITLVAHMVLHLPLVEAGMLGFIVAAVSPAVVVPSMLSLKQKGLGTKQGVPVIVLAGASVDDVFAITLFTVFLGLATQGDQPIVWQIAQIPLRIAGGTLLGAILGWLLYRLYRRFHLSNLAKLGTAMAAAFVALLIGEQYQLAGLLGVMTLGFVLLEKANGIAITLERGLNQVWFFAQIFLFVLIGAQVNISVAWQAGLLGLIVIGAGIMARTLGVMIALHRSHLRFRERLFCAVAYTPKATVQAAIGGIPLAMGIASGETILAVAVLAVVITASLGAMGIQFSAPRLLDRDDTMTKIEVSEAATQLPLKHTRVKKEYG